MTEETLQGAGHLPLVPGDPSPNPMDSQLAVRVPAVGAKAGLSVMHPRSEVIGKRSPAFIVTLSRRLGGITLLVG